MAIYLSPQQGIKELVSQLETELAAFAREMLAKPQAMRVDAAYSIPFRGQGPVDPQKDIEVTPLTGLEATRLIVDGLTATRIVPGEQNPRETLRAPGAVAMPRKWIDRLAELNQTKIQIEALVALIPDQTERVKVWQSSAYLSGLQTMRHAWLIKPPRRIRFYWDAVPSIKPTTVAALVATYTKQLRTYFGYVPGADELDQGDPHHRYTDALQLLADLPPSERIAVYREGKPHVRARVIFLDGLPAAIRPCSSPIIYETGDPVPLITALEKWEPTLRTEQRSKRAKIEAEPLLRSLYLYRYLPPYRFST